MNIISLAFTEVLYRPLYNALIILYDIIPGHDLGLAIIILTVLLRLALHPFSVKAIKSQKRLQEIQPEIQALQQKYKNDKQKQAAAIMDFYREKNISPMSGCVPLLIQLPILIALYQVFLAGLNSHGAVSLYGFVPRPEHISPITLGVFDLSKSNIILAIVAGFAQFIQTKMLMVSNKKKATAGKNKPGKEGDFTQEFSEAMNKQMLYFMPIFTVFIAAKFPAGLALYWVITTVFSIAQQYFIFKTTSKSPSYPSAS